MVADPRSTAAGRVLSGHGGQMVGSTRERPLPSTRPTSRTYKDGVLVYRGAAGSGSLIASVGGALAVLQPLRMGNAPKVTGMPEAGPSGGPLGRPKLLAGIG